MHDSEANLENILAGYRQIYLSYHQICYIASPVNASLGTHTPQESVFQATRHLLILAQNRPIVFPQKVPHLWNTALILPTWAILADKIVLHIASIIIPLIKVWPSQTRVCSWLMIHHNTGFTSTGRLICIPISSSTIIEISFQILMARFTRMPKKRVYINEDMSTPMAPSSSNICCISHSSFVK